MRLFYVTTSDSPHPRDGHDAVRWLSNVDLTEVHWLESDRVVLGHLGLESS